MRGTEKQIAWATDIINKVVPVMEQAIADIRTMTGDEAVKAANIEGFEQRIEALKNAEYAGDVISLFGDVKITGDQDKDVFRVFAVYRNTRPATASQQKILCK